MISVPYLLKVSRPRFWIYVFGPYIVGLAAGAVSPADFFGWRQIIYGIYFLLPANLLIYGINDIFDYETDLLNEKKSEYEVLTDAGKHRGLAVAIAVTNVPFLIPALLYPSRIAPALAGFAFFSIFYSAPSIRAKAIPFLDSAFNILYVFPAILAYSILTGEYPPLGVIAAAAAWTAAMHAYSAVPDIESDRSAGLSTIATTLGARGTLLLCGALYVLSAALSFKYLTYLSVAAGLIYAAMIAVSFVVEKRGRLFEVYRLFPWINSLMGFLLFWYIVITRFGI